MQPLARLRLRLTAWYAGSSCRSSRCWVGDCSSRSGTACRSSSTPSLRGATSALMQAARIREAELASAKGVVADAVDELHIPDRSLYLLAEGATPVRPAEAPDWIRDAAGRPSVPGRHTASERRNKTTSCGSTPSASPARMVRCMWPPRWPTGWSSSTSTPR